MGSIASLRARTAAIIAALVPDVVPEARYVEESYARPLDELPKGASSRDTMRGFHVRALPALDPRTQGSCFVAVQHLRIDVRYDSTYPLDRHRLATLDDLAYSDQVRIQAALLAPYSETYGYPASPGTADFFDTIAFVGATELVQSDVATQLWLTSLTFELEYRRASP